MAEPQTLEVGPKTVRITARAFGPGEAIPQKHTCQGEDVSPRLLIDNVPNDARSLALIMDDPDAPNGTFTHWLLWNLPADSFELEEGADVNTLDATVGKNDFNETSYRGPCPPSGEHRYRFRIYALRDTLDVPRGAKRRTLEDAMQGQVVAWGELTGTYRKG